ncbi:MAG: hypothetical protein K6E47_01790 [Lachnospiraceae bacterium]|nr:hypothetical protein [Lachnospiraceae bacterium]
MSDRKYNTITLPQVFWKVLSRWWVVVICAVLGGVLLYKFSARDYDAKLKAYENDSSAYAAKCKEYDEVFEFNTEYRALSGGSESEKAKKADEMAEFSKKRLSSDQLVTINDALELKEQMQQVSGIKDELITARVNPYSIPVLSAIYLIKTEVSTDLPTLKAYYQSAHDSQRIWTDLYAELGYPEEEYSQFSGCNTFSISSDYRVTLTLYYDDMEGLKEVKTALLKVMDAVKKDVAKKSGMAHELELMEANTFSKADNNIATQQNTYKQWIVDYTNRLASLKATFALPQNAIMSNYYEYLADKVDGGNGYVNVKDLEKPLENENAAAKPRDPKLMGIIGAAAGFILGIAVIVLIMIFAGRLQKAEELPEMFSLGLIGTLLSNGFTLPFEKLVKYLSTRRYGAFSVDKRVKLTAVKLKVLCDTKGIKNIVLSGTATDSGAGSKNKAVIDKLKSELDSMGIRTEACGSILKSPEVFQKAAETGNIIFVEREIRSAYADIEREILIAGDCGIDILGGICIY